MTLRKQVRPCEMLPRGYRLAWFDWRTQRGICYPFGLHVVAWAMWRLWDKTFFRLPASAADALREENHLLKQQNRELLEEREAAWLAAN